MTPKELSMMLAQNVEAVAQMLLPEGKREGHEWRVGSVNGESGKSLGVHLSGHKAGVWADFTTGDSGDLIDLWGAVRRLSLKEAIGEVRAYLGVQTPSRVLNNSRAYSRPQKPKCTAAKPESEVGAYLKSRGLTAETLDAFRVAENAKGEIVLPSLRDGELVFVKYLQVKRDENGKKKMRVEADCEPCLFGWQAVSPQSREVVITEGEIDAMSVFQLGFNALSIPFGGGGGDKQRWIDYEFENLERFDVIYLALDADAAGKEATKIIAERLGVERCRVVDIPAPHKDANDLLLAGFDTLKFSALLEKSTTQDPEELKQASGYLDQVLAAFYPAHEREEGVRTPWHSVGDNLLFRPGELSILAGINGHGKSQIAGHMLLEAVRQEYRCCVASMEFQAYRWLKRLTKQACAEDIPSPQKIRDAHEWYRDRLWVFDVVGNTKAARILEVFRYARRRYGITFFIIDNLAKCGIAEDDYRAQKDFIDTLTDFAKASQCHVMLLHHMRKSQDEKFHSGKMDIKGTGAITDMADTVMTIWRNKGREERIRQGELAEVEREAGARLSIEKQRNGDSEPKIDLWFDLNSYQYHEFNPPRPFAYVGKPRTYKDEVYF
jgi:twinkle protein